MDRYVTDIKNGCYQNPVLPMDFSDPDAIRVGEDYYLISSSFTYLPGVPVLHSKDLVHWERIGNCVERLPFDRYAQPAHGCGIWAPALRGMGNGLGAFIYLMDAYDDLEKDSRRGQFNALQQLADELPPAAYEQRCHELLTQQMGRCAQQFEMLPILKDTPEGKLLYNTIYSGVWSKYALVRKHREARRHD